MLAIVGLVTGQDRVVEDRLYSTKKIIGKAPVIDGVINDDVWNQIDWQGDFIQQSPYEFAAPTQQTKFKILYDDNNMYVAIRAFDTEPQKIERRLSRRDGFEGDWVSVSFDSYNDDKTGFNFYVTAAGVKGDVINTLDRNSDRTWDPVWYTKVSVDEKGWNAEMKIPLTQLRFPKQDSYEWGLQVRRRLFRTQELSIWQMIPKDVSGSVSRWGNLVGIENINPKKEVELIPYVMGSLEKSPKEEGNPFATGSEFGYNAGVDGKVAVTNDLTLNFTINPDFGQVEADPSEVNLTAFESFFPEKRPFFIEGSSIFSFPLQGNHSRTNLFYSRRIGRRPHSYPDLSDNEYANVPEFTRILGAFKLSGKTSNGWSIGVMESITNKEFATIDSLGNRRKEAVEPLTNFFNIRVQKDLNDGNTVVGGMVTATNRFINDNQLKFLPTAAYSGGIDFMQYWNNKDYYISGKLSYSYVTGDSSSITKLQRAPQRYYQRPDMDHRNVDSSLRVLTGSSGNFEGGKIGGGHWRYGLRVWWLSPGLDINDMGFMQRADAVSQTAWVNYVIWEPFSIFRNMNLGINQWSWYDFSGRYLNLGVRFNAYMRFMNYWSVRTGVTRDFADINRSELRGGPSLVFPGNWRTYLRIHSDDTRKLMFSINGSITMSENNDRTSKSIGLGVTYIPINALKISLRPSYSTNYDIARYVTTNESGEGKKYIVGGLERHVTSMDIRVNLSLTPDLSLQYWGQPFLYSADYSRYADVVDAGNFNIREQYKVFEGDDISYDEENATYTVKYSNGELYEFDNPDFSVFEFRSNFVLRWEYIPGSTAYLVWSQGRAGNDPSGNFSFNEHIENLVDLDPSNIFLLKFSYRLSM